MTSDLVVYRITTNEKKRIILHYDKTNNEIQNDIEHLKKWFIQQPHLPQNPDEGLLLRMLRLNKFNLTKTQVKLDNYFTYRNRMPEFFADRDLTSVQIENIRKAVCFVPLPKLTKALSRVYVAKLLDTDPSIFDFDTLFKYVFLIGDVRIHNDDCASDVYIIDFSGVQLWHILKFKPFLVKKAFHLIKNVFSDRILGIHFLNTPTYANLVINLTKSILSSKIANRVFVHNDYKTLHTFVDSSTLPIEYKGTEISIGKLIENWHQFVTKKNAWLIELGNKKSNEELRPKPL